VLVMSRFVWECDANIRGEPHANAAQVALRQVVQRVCVCVCLCRCGWCEWTHTHDMIHVCVCAHALTAMCVFSCTATVMRWRGVGLRPVHCTVTIRAINNTGRSCLHKCHASQHSLVVERQAPSHSLWDKGVSTVVAWDCAQGAHVKPGFVLWATTQLGH
jgi:hypothetical protein